jgi:hypothetical protein
VRAAISRLASVALALVLAGSVPLVAQAGRITGTVFEDVNFGGGAGRDLFGSGGIRLSGAIVEAYDGTTGDFVNSSTTDSTGTYKINGVGSRLYILRVVGSSVRSTRPGFVPGTELAVPTFHIDATFGTVVPVTNDVGGRQPAQPDAPAGSSGARINVTTYQFIAGPTGYAQSASPVQGPTNNNAIVVGVDFGYNFDLVVNPNASGAGSLRQFLINANGLANAGLFQSGFAPGTEHALFMISNGTGAPGLRASLNYFTGGVARIALTAALPKITESLVLDAQRQPGWISSPVVAVDGTAAGAGSNGIEILAPGCEVRGFALGGFGGSGVVISGAGGIVSGNWIGLDPTGTAALANHVDGLQVGADGVIVGGSTAQTRNVVSGNGANGIRVLSTTSGGSLRGNYVGTNAAGSSGIPNGSLVPASAGLEVDGDNLTIGGSGAGDGNVVSGNTGVGVRMSGFANRFVGNTIGMDASRSLALGNTGHGLLVSGGFGGSNLAIGGVNAGEGNLIAHNGGAGVAFDPAAGNGNMVLGNAIGTNGALGIDLGNDGITANDPLDADTGANDLQNFPVLTLVRTGGTTLRVQGTLASEPNSSFRLEYFASATGDPSGNGEGERYLGSTDVASDGAGSAPFDTTFAANVAIGEAVTVTATSLDFSNTSEFSNAMLAADAAAIIVSPTSGLVTSESGDSALATIVLQSQPTSTVTIPLVSTKPAEGTPSPASVVFTPADWNLPHTVTIHGVDDFRIDGDQPYVIQVQPAVSSDSHYSGRDGADISVVNTDNDVAGIRVAPTTGLVTTEGGGTATFTVRLDTQPDADVSLPLASTNTAEGTVAPASLTFTGVNWNVPQTVTVTGVDDAVADGNQAYNVTTGAATSADVHYSGLDAADVGVTNTDDDGVGVTLTPGAGLVTTEAGGTATFTARLTSKPSADASFTLTSSRPAEGTVSPASLTFTSADWNVPQTVTVTGVDDSAVDGDQAYTIVTGAVASADAGYTGYDPADVGVTNTDDDVAGATPTPTAGLVTSEAGGTATFTLVLTSQPSADVTFPVSSSNASEGTAAPACLTFTAADWNVPQTVTVTGADDFVADGTVAYTITIGAGTSSDPHYSGYDPADVGASNTDNDAVGVDVTPTAGLVTSEAGGTATFTVKLASQPTANVSIAVASDDATEGTAAPASLTFTAADWSTPQTVTVTGADDFVADGTVGYHIVLAAATSADAGYAGQDPADVAVTNTDNDAAGITVSPTAGLVTTEAGGTATFTVVLTSQPTADVAVAVASSDAAEGTSAPASLTFTASDWSTPQTVTVTGVDDAVQDGDRPYTIVLAAATSADPNYAGQDPADVAVTNTDNDVAGITVTPTAGLVTSEAGGTATFTVRLTSQPVADVVIPVSSGNPAEGSVSPASLTFTASDWNAPQTVTVTGVDDPAVDGDVAYTVAVEPATSSDPVYAGKDGADVSATNTDNDVAGITVAPTAGLVTTEAGGTATFTVRLDSKPAADVVIPVASDDATEGVAAPASLTFTPADWNQPQTVTVTGVDDAIADGNVAYHVVLAAATSSDANYSGRDAADVAVSNSDDDAPGITVAPLTGLVTTEAGGTATFTIVLGSQPTANVVIPVSSSNPAEGSVAPASVTFTTANWSIPQTITVTGVDDAVDDGDVVYTLATGAATSTDPNYSGADAADVSATNRDDDTAGTTVTPTAGLVTTEAGGTATFTVRLNSQPTANVVIPVSSSKPAEGVPSAATLTFTAADWNTPQTVTVTGVDDQVQDGSIAYTIVLAAAASGDAKYSGQDPADVAVTNTDNDVAGITVTPVAGLVTTEAGGTASFTVVLTSQPTADVSIGLSSADPTEGRVAPAGLTFTAANWNVPQTATVTGIDDALDDGDIAYTIATAAASSTDPNYSGRNAADVAVTNLDDDTAGISVAPTAGLVTTESGGTATFTVRLDSQPTANVVIPVASSNPAEGTVSAPSLTFTAANWNVARTVTVTGVDDQVQDGNIAYTIVLGAATSTDPRYSGTNPADVSVTNTDNDAAGITVTPTTGLVTTEAGGTASFTVRLNSQPTASVAIPVASSNPAEGTVSTASLTFSTANWNVAQTVTVTGVDDQVQDGNIAYTIQLAAAASGDPRYAGMDPADVSASNTDNDVAGITVTPTAGLVTTEAGGTATFTVVLTSQPTANVAIPVTSGNPAEGAVSTASLTFTAANWSVAQPVTLTGVDDQVQDGDVAYTVVLAAAASADPRYAGMDPADVSATNTDNDVAGITVTPTAGLVTTEAGGTATFTVVLTSQPTANVVIPVTSSKPAEGTASTSSLTFTAANWNTAQTVTVTGVDDQVKDGDIAYTIVLAAATSSDPRYSGMDAADVAATNTDNDASGVSVTPVAGLVTTEAGGTASFTVRLFSQPTADVTIPIASSNPAEGSVSAASLTFTAASWNVAQTVTVTGVDDQVKDGDVAYTIVLSPAASADPVYAGVDPADVSATNTDNDVAGITVTPTAGLVTAEWGGTATFTVRLQTQPTANVVIPISSSNPAEGSVSPASLTFTAANWNVARTVTVTGVDDQVQDGNIAYTIVTGAAASADPVYNGMDPADVSASNTDNDAAGITVNPVAGLVTSEAGGAAAFFVVLTSQPTADVTIPLSSSNPAEGTVSTASLTFTSANWSAPQTVTVRGVNDAVVDGTIAYTIVTGAAASTDARYAGLDPADVSASNTDDDSIGVFVSPVAGLVTTEAGGTATYSVVLRSQPTADVVIPITSSDVSEGIVSAPSLTFSPGDWNTPQVVTVTGVDDALPDGDVPYQVANGVVQSADPEYAGLDPADVSLVNRDDQDGSNIVLELVPDRDKVQQGQPVGFRLSVRNRTSLPIDAITLTHTLPVRFAAIKGTLMRNGQVIADQGGPVQTLPLAHLDGFVDRNGDGIAGPGEPGYAEFRWQLVAGAGASSGSYLDRVSATSGCDTCSSAVPVSAVVHVEDNELFTRSTLLGRVFEDKNRDGQQAANEPGIAGARVVMDDGTSVTTDAMGMFHVPDLESGPRAVKLDVPGLGAAAIPTTDASTLVTIAPGLLSSVRFGVAFPRDTVAVGRAGGNGLAVSATEPEGILDLAGNTTHSELTINGITIPVHATGTTVTPPAFAPHYPAVRLGSLAVPVDRAGRFATSVPHPGGDTLEVALVDNLGRVSAGHVRLPRLDILSPRGEVRLPFGQASADVKLASHAADSSGGGVPLASTDGAAGDRPVAWTQVRGRTDSSAVVEVNGRKVAVGADGGFTSQVALHVGENTISVMAHDATGMSNLTHVTVQVADREADGTPVVAVDAIPELSLFLPPKGVALKSPALTLAGHTHAGYRLVVNRDTVAVNGDGSFSHRLMLAEGNNHLDVSVVDDKGRTSSIERDLEVRSPQMFLVGLADGVVGRSSGAAFLRPGGDKETYTEGRLAWNLRGWISGRYLVTSAFDSRRRDFNSLFKNLDDAGRDRLLTNLDPDRLYPVFGDSGSVQNSSLSGGRLYVGLQGEAVRASLGNFPIALNDVELAGFHRTLYGAQMGFGKAAGVQNIASGTSVALFGAEASHVHVHDVLEATGGTLYYLSHGDVLEGSAQVTLVVRDRNTGLQLARVPQRSGIDVVVKEFEGRVQFTRPIASVWDDGGVIGSGRLQGHPVTIEVDYETAGHGGEKTAAGGRITQNVGDKLTLGSTVVDDRSGDGDYRLRGTDLTLNMGHGTRLLGELATSHGHTGRSFVSTDGGLAWNEADSANTNEGLAWKTAAEVDLGQWLHRPGLASVSGYVRRVDAGFLSDGERAGVALDRSGVRGQLSAGRYGLLSGRFDRETRPEMNQLGQIDGTDVYGMQWRVDGARTGAATEFEQRNTTRVLDPTDKNSTGAMRLWWKPVERVKTTVEHQQTFAGEKASQSALALEWRALPTLALEARGSTGDQGKTIRGGATMSVGARQFYVREEQAQSTTGLRGGTLFGMQAPLGPESRVYSEYQWQRDPLGDHGVSVTGIEQGWHNAEGLSLNVAGEHGTRGGDSGQHGTISGQIAYKGNSPLSGSSRAEARRMLGSTYSRQMLSATRLELALPSGFTVLTDLRMSMSRRLEQMYTTPNRFTESSVGLAWRAPRSDAVQALGRWTRLADRRGPEPGDSLGTASVLGVAALEATVRVFPGLEWAAKGAARLDQSGRSGLPLGTAHSTMWASRLDYRIAQQPFRLGVEYRLLEQREAADTRGGWLQELSYDPGQHVRFGIGYNFSRFSGDPLVRNQDTSRGWFLRAQSRY